MCALSRLSSPQLFLKMVFRIFSETLWYPGQKMNHMSLRSAEQGKSKRNRDRQLADGSSTPTSGGAVVSQVCNCCNCCNC